MTDAAIWLLPPLAAGASAVLTAFQLPRLRGERYLRRRRVLWAFWHLLDSDEFTEAGLQLRTRYALHATRFVVCGLVGAAIAGALAAR